MPFQTLLFDGLLPGTSAGEQGLTVSVKPEKGEVVLFFQLDQPFQTATGLRRYLKDDQPVADLLVFFRRDRNATVRLCLVELKGGDVAHAEKQLLSTHAILQRQMKSVEVGRGRRPEVEWMAVIRTRGASPTLLRKAELANAFGKNVRVLRDSDISTFLRGAGPSV